MFNGTGGQGVGNFIAKDTTVREVRTAKKQFSNTEIGDAAVAIYLLAQHLQNRPGRNAPPQ